MTSQNQRDRDNDFDPYSSPRAFYGSELRLAREKSGLSQDRLGDRVFCSGTYIGQFEAATRRPQPDVSRLLDGVFGTGDRFQRLCAFANRSKFAEYFARAAELEQEAATISQCVPLLIPGMLQTAKYARALTRATLPSASEEEVEGYVRSRLERAQLLESTSGPELWAVVHEAALRISLDTQDVMEEQLTVLADMARTHHRVTVQVLPFSEGLSPLMYGTTLAMTFADRQPVAYTESAHSGQLIDDPKTVIKYQRSYDLTRAAALSPKASLRLIESAARDYRRT